MGIMQTLRAALTVPAPTYTEPTPLGSPWQDPTILQKVVFEDLYGTTLAADALPIQRSTALGIPALARARHVIVNALTLIPLIAADTNGRLDAQPTLLTDPDPDVMPGLVQRLWTVDDVFFYGRSIWVALAREGDRITRARRVDQAQAHPKQHDASVWVIGDREVPARDVIVIYGPHEGILARRGPLRAALAIQAAYLNAARSPVPNIELHDTGTEILTDEEIDRLIDRWAQARRGENGGVAYTSKGIEANAHGAHPEALMIRGRDRADLDMAQLVGIPADAIDAAANGSSMTYVNRQATWERLWQSGLAAYGLAIAGSLSAHLGATESARFDIESVTTPTYKDRMNGHKAAIDAGIWTPDQIREREESTKYVQ